MNILFARFRLNSQSLRGFRLGVMDFPYWRALHSFQRDMQQLATDERSSRRRVDIPWRSLNSALQVSAPMLVHPFEKYKRQDNNRWHRRALTLLQEEGSDTYPPSVNDISRVVNDWAQLWIDRNFETQIRGTRGQHLYNQLVDQIHSRSEVEGWEIFDAFDLWSNPDLGHRLSWDAIPSLLASLLVSKETPVALRSSEGEHYVHWRLAQAGGKHLMVVSEPFESDRGWLSYALNFSIQTQGGSSDRWVYLHASLRRYPHQQIAWVNDSNVTVMLSMHQQPRIEGWSVMPTMVRVPVVGYANTPVWGDSVVDLLSRMNARPLTDITEIFDNPEHFFTQDVEGDTYHIVYAEGMRPRHQAKTGIGLEERRQLLEGILDQLDGVLEIGSAIPIDDESTLAFRGANTNSIRQRRTDGELDLLAMMTFNDLDRSAGGIKLYHRSEDDLQDKHDLTIERLSIAIQQRRLRILLCYRQTSSIETFYEYVNRFLFLGQDEELLDDITIHAIAITGEQGSKHTFSEDHNDTQSLTVEFRQKVAEWENLFSENIGDEDEVILALVEMDGSIQNVNHQDDYLKHAIRRAAVRHGVSTQMIYSLSGYRLPSRQAIADISRLKKAVPDLLIRQTGLLYASPVQIYRHSGLDNSVADNLTTIGLYKHRQWVRENIWVEFPIAIVLRSQGQVEVILPNTETGQPEPSIPYTDAVSEIGGRWTQYRTANRDRQLIDYSFDPGEDRVTYARLRVFAAGILQAEYKSATLVLIDAMDWRYRILPGLQDPQLSGGILKLDQQTTLLASDNPKLRIIRVRGGAAQQEAPQYFYTEREDLSLIDDADDPEPMIGASDNNSEANFPVYYSIGRRPVTVRFGGDTSSNDLFNFEEPGASYAHRHQQALEIIPFFTQPEDDPLTWCRVAHFLRFSPAWDGGNTVLPYPMHLAKALLSDLMAVFQP